MVPETSVPPITALRCWILSDGKAGDEVQCLGVAEAMGLAPEIHRVAPGWPWTWLMPWGPIPPRDRPDRSGSPLAPPFPDIAIASGRRTVAYLRALKAASGGRSFTVFLKDPRVGTGAADFIWVPAHDPLRGDNVLATLTSPHRITPERLQAAGAAPPAVLASALARPGPRAAVLLGGDSRHDRFTGDDVVRLTAQLAALAQSGVTLLVTASRRTPPALREGVAALVRAKGGFLWDGTGENPYLAMLALADGIVVTGDSVNMVGEACVTGKPVLVFAPTPRQAGETRISAFLKGLRDHGAVRSFQGRLESYAYEPLNSTQTIADSITAAFRRHRAGLGLP